MILRDLALIFAFTLMMFDSLGQKIHPYDMYSDHFVIERYTKQYDRTFDSVGIILQKNHYHPLTISIYGIMCHDQFVRTGDSTYLTEVKNQFIYFRDTSRLDYHYDNKGIGLPYHFNFNDLKAPWYSGLTQGAAISFLLRYYNLTKDEYALELTEKITYLMLQPETEFGTISKTSEGRTWIEEYPTSKKSINVLNGFINGLVGLKEYCDFFPNDTMAKRIHSEVYNSFVDLLEKFDTPTWTNYNRNNKSISKSYMRIQLTQLDHLYLIYKDDRLLRQMMIWSMMMGNKLDTDLHFLSKPRYIYSTLTKVDSLGDEGRVRHYPDIQSKLNNFWRVDSTVLVGKKDSKLREFEGPAYIKNKTILKYNEPRNSIRLNFSNDKFIELDFLTKDQNGEWIHIPFYRDSMGVTISSINEFSRVLISTKKKFELSEIACYSYKFYDVPKYAHTFFSSSLQLEKDKRYSVYLPRTNVPKCVIFYKHADSKQLLKSSKWTHYNYFEEGHFVPSKDGFYDFFVSYQILNPNSSIGALEIYE
jgi:heparosan-N-sulfate-glucuronate 5-epimerase